ncbi:MAG: hypothetical protein QM775_13700 [Pirellulales bacterium]
MSQIVRRVVKLGGSLLGEAELPLRWQQWLAAQSPAQTLVVVGGGGLADTVAELQKLHGRMTDAAAHWLCIRAMQWNAELIVGLLPEAEYVGDVAALMQRPPAIGTYVVDPWAFMQTDARTSRPLPESWDVSSDAVAARLAAAIAADELVLLKSALPADAVRTGDYVDRAFTKEAALLKAVRFVNLGDAAFPEVRRQ